MKSFWTLLLAVFAVLPSGRAAAAPLQFPLVCDAGLGCFITSYPDLNAQSGVAQDYACGAGAKDGDVSLRIGLRDVGVMLDGGAVVVAAADGIVVASHDGEDDHLTQDSRALPADVPSCGNGIVIDHGGGMQTSYCHLKRDSVKTRKGQRVARGQVIGAAGLSGWVTWPQLAFSLKKGGYYVDPSSGASVVEGCGAVVRPEMDFPASFAAYQPAAILSLGVALDAVSEREITLGQAPRYATINRNEPGMTIWAMLANIQAGDAVEIRMRDPRGRRVHHQEFNAQKAASRLPLNIPLKPGFGGWRRGMYEASISITREVKRGPARVSRAVTLIVE